MLSMQATLAHALTTTPSSFEEAYRAHAQTVARWARQLAGTDSDVEDIVQEVFMVVSRQLAGFRGEARFTSWLFEITRKVAANHRRRQRWWFWRSNDQDALNRMPAPAGDPLAELERRQAGALFYRALDKLPDKYRTVLVLYEIEGLSTREIAELCNTSWVTTKVHLHRAREKFLRSYQTILKKGAP